MIIRLIDQNEIAGFLKAGQAAGLILKHLVEQVRPGRTTLELDKIFREECDNINAVPTFLNYKGFPAALCASVNNILVHGIPNDTPLQLDDILSLDVGVTIDGFIGDTATTTVVEQFKDAWSYNTYGGYTGSTSPIGDMWPSWSTYASPTLLSSCKDALYRGIRKAKADNKLSDIINEIYNIAYKNKLQVPLGFGGHGISRNKLHDNPYIPNSFEGLYEDVVLVPGMVLAIEPMFIDAKSNGLTILEDGWSVRAEGNTAHFEHTIVVTEGEPIILTENSSLPPFLRMDLPAIKEQVGKWK